MNETLNVKIKIDTSNASASLNNTVSQVKSLSGASEKTTESINQAVSSLNSIKSLSLSSLASSILLVSSKLKRINSDIKKMTGGFKGLFSIATDSDYVSEVGKFGAITGAIGHGIDGIKTGFKGVAETIRKSCIPALSKLALIIGTITAAIALVKNAISVAANGDEIKDESQKLHLNTTAYQEWGFVMEQNGVEMSSLKTGMRQFSNEVASGGDKLKKYGIYTTDVSKAFEEAIFTIQGYSEKYKKTLSEAEIETKKIAAMTDLFGTRASELMPILNMTNAETRSLMETYRAISGTMSDELISYSDRLTDSITTMKAAWQGLKNTLGTLLIPMLTTVVEKITVIISKISIFLKAVFGIEETFGSNGRAADGSGTLADNLSDSESSAKNISKYLAGFDELNVYSSSNSTTSDDTIDTSDYSSYSSSGLFSSDMLANIEEFKKKMDDITSKVDLAIPVLTTAAGLVALLTGHFALGAGLLGMGLGSIIGQTLLDKLDDKWKMAMSGLMAGAGVALILLGHPIAGASLLGISLGTASTIDWAGWAEGVKTSWNDLKTAWGQYCDDIKLEWDAVKEAVAVWWKENVSDNWKDAKEAWKEYCDDIKVKWDAVKTAVKEYTVSIKAKWEGKKDEIAEKWKAVKDAIKDYNVSLKASWDTKKSDLEEKWKNLTSGIKDKTISIKLKLTATISNIKDWINTSIIDKLNNSFSNVPLLKKVKIPKLAGGGIIDQPTIAMMGEYAGASNNPEIVAPQSIFQDMINAGNSDVINAFAQMTRQIIGAIEDVDMNVSIGDDVIAKSASRGNNAYKKMTGKPLFSY